MPASNLGAAISAGGLFIAFGSSASNLSQGDTPGTGDIFVVDSTSGRSAIILESANSPAILTADGVIALTGDHNGVTLGVSDPTGRFTASFDAQGNIEWHFSEPRSDFASLLPGQISTQNFVITLSTPAAQRRFRSGSASMTPISLLSRRWPTPAPLPATTPPTR